jgi:hypothetical protein
LRILLLRGSYAAIGPVKSVTLPTQRGTQPSDGLFFCGGGQYCFGGLKTRAIAEARIKYDKLDASILADLAGADLISKCYVPDKYIREIRTLIRHRIDLARRRTQLKNKLHTTLDILNSAPDTTLRNYIRCFFFAFSISAAVKLTKRKNVRDTNTPLNLYVSLSRVLYA